jgi:hypothetical protein
MALHNPRMNRKDVPSERLYNTPRIFRGVLSNHSAFSATPKLFSYKDLISALRLQRAAFSPTSNIKLVK